MDSTVPIGLLKLRDRLEAWRATCKYAREPILRGTPLGDESEQNFLPFSRSVSASTP
jgi:hypothetical protein